MAKFLNVKPYLIKAFEWTSYDKNKAQTKKLIAPIVTKDKVETAVQASKRVREHHKRAGTIFPANPSTDVDLLIESINDAVSAAKKMKTG